MLLMKGQYEYLEVCKQQQVLCVQLFQVLMQFRVSFRAELLSKVQSNAPHHPQICLSLLKKASPSASIELPLSLTANEALCISMATASAVACSSSRGFCIEMGSRGERTPGGQDTLSAALQTGKRKHSHVMMEFAPSLSPPPSLFISPSFPRLAGRTIARWAAAPPHAPAH